MEGAEVCEEVAQGPAGVRGCGGRVEERDRALLGWDIREELFVLLDRRKLGFVGAGLRADEKECARSGEKGGFDGGELAECGDERVGEDVG